MRRFLSVWLPRWPIERRFRAAGYRPRSTSESPHQTDKRPKSQSPGHQNTAPAPFGNSLGAVSLGSAPLDRPPFALIVSGEGRVLIAATNPAAEKVGIHAGLSLTDARALYPDLHTAEATPAQDLKALTRLTLWCQRYSPLVTVHPPDGLALDITGCAHLFGGEQAMLGDIASRFSNFHLTHHLALADSIGTAWAAARFGKKTIIHVREGQNTSYLAPLPLAALRLDVSLTSRLNQLGLRKINHLLEAPEAPLVSRFGPNLIRRLHQATGEEPEIFGPLSPPPVYHVRYSFEEPALHLIALEAALEILAKKMEQVLKEDLKGARSLDVQIFRVDGHVESLSIGTSRLCQQAGHITLLFRENLSDFHDDLDTGFGIDLMTMAAYGVEDMKDEQKRLQCDEMQAEDKYTHPSSHQEMAELLDRFGNRFGFDQVTRFWTQNSYIPEKSFQKMSVRAAGKRPPWLTENRRTPPRPFLLFTPPEPITVLAEVPDGPPLRFEWRRLQHHITRAEGPERLAPEWWDVPKVSDTRIPQTSRQSRDYYRVEDQAGHRFWLYRDGLYDRAGDLPRWYMQGLFP